VVQKGENPVVRRKKGGEEKHGSNRQEISSMEVKKGCVNLGGMLQQNQRSEKRGGKKKGTGIRKRGGGFVFISS